MITPTLLRARSPIRFHDHAREESLRDGPWIGTIPPAMAASQYTLPTYGVPEF
jgi:hypothetical protein